MPDLRDADGSGRLLATEKVWLDRIQEAREEERIRFQNLLLEKEEECRRLGDLAEEWAGKLRAAEVEIEKQKESINQLQSIISGYEENGRRCDAVEIERLRENKPEISPWQPIETAPRDGTTALFFQKGNPEASVVRARNDVIRIDEDRSLNGKYFYRELPEAPYTHWMPLPEPPTQGGES